MTHSYKNQALTLLIVGVLLSPSIYFVFNLPRGNDMASGIYGLMIMMFLTLPAVASVVCIGLGIGRLSAARRMPAAPASTQPNGLPSDVRRRKSDYVALVGLTVILAILALSMAAIIVYVLVLKGDWFGFAIYGAAPVAILLTTLIFIPLNIRKIRREKRAIAD